MLDEAAYEAEQRAYLARRWEAVPSVVEELRPSEWAEKHRYLPPSVTSLPGAYSFDLVPYLKEIVDNLAVDSPIREVTFMKGSQLGATVGILENFLGYIIEHVRTSPVMWVTVDAEIAKLRMETCVTPMLQHSGLSHLITSIDEGNARKTGKTDKKLEWEGGGWLVPQGAKNADKMRSVSVRFLLRDEIDGWPLSVGRDGDPMRLTLARTDFYEDSRKILDISTPLLKGQSQIEQRYKAGDQRRYFVCCLKCSHPQILKFRHTSEVTGERSGLVWETEGGNLVPDSVRYVCQNDDCNHAHINEDKVRLLSPHNGAEWRPTAQPTTPYHRSYHLSALYAPPGTRSWEAIAFRWIEAWDDEKNRPRDFNKLQTFYNNELGETFEVRGEKLRFEQVSPHRRHFYKYGEIPNKTLAQVCGSPVLLLVCTVDVHKDSLAVAVWGWCRDKRVALINYWRFEGDTEQLDNPDTWGALRKLIEEREWTADDGKRYVLSVTLIDSGYRTDHVVEFCSLMGPGVYPVKGRDEAAGNLTIRPVSQFKTGATTGYGITVDFYKDRWSAALRRGWDGIGLQPAPYFNAPLDVTDAQLKELTVETKVEKVDRISKQRVGWEWHRPSGAPNELWDLLVYASAGFDLVALNVCLEDLKLESTNWVAFWDFCEANPFYTLAPS